MSCVLHLRSTSGFNDTITSRHRVGKLDNQKSILGKCNNWRWKVCEKDRPDFIWDFWLAICFFLFSVLHFWAEWASFLLFLSLLLPFPIFNPSIDRNFLLFSSIPFPFCWQHFPHPPFTKCPYHHPSQIGSFAHPFSIRHFLLGKLHTQNLNWIIYLGGFLRETYSSLYSHSMDSMDHHSFASSSSHVSSIYLTCLLLRAPLTGGVSWRWFKWFLPDRYLWTDQMSRTQNWSWSCFAGKITGESLFPFSTFLTVCLCGHLVTDNFTPTDVYFHASNTLFFPFTIGQVVMLQQQLLPGNTTATSQLPNLPIPDRRLVCFCRLYEVPDVNRKDRPGQHQREIFLFNDLLLVTKIVYNKNNRKSNNNNSNNSYNISSQTTINNNNSHNGSSAIASSNGVNNENKQNVLSMSNQFYSYRGSYPLLGLVVKIFETTYYPYGIKIIRRLDDKVILTFNARNSHDRNRFVLDLKESIEEMHLTEASINFLKNNNWKSLPIVPSSITSSVNLSHSSSSPLMNSWERKDAVPFWSSHSRHSIVNEEGKET